MYTLTVKNEVLPEYAYYMELSTQCALAKLSFLRLKEYARVQVEGSLGSKIDRPKTPIEVISDCTSFLSAAAMISKFLFPNEKANKKIKERAEKLRNKIKITSFPTIGSKHVRNSFEHADERLDKYLDGIGDGDLCSVHIAKSLPKTQFVLKRFNPTTLEISFLNDSINIQNCFNEIDELIAKLKTAMQ